MTEIGSSLCAEIRGLRREENLWESRKGSSWTNEKTFKKGLSISKNRNVARDIQRKTVKRLSRKVRSW